MDAAMLGNFAKGNSVSQTAERTKFRNVRRLIERNKLRRERLLRVLDIMGFLPEHFSSQIDRYGKFKNHGEPKLPWKCIDAGKRKYEFLFKDSYNEMIEDFKLHQPGFMEEGGKVPYDWTLYYLRKKALTQPVAKEELAWILLNFNAKRGYYQLRGEEEEDDDNKLVEYHALKVVDVVDTGQKKGKATWYDIILENGMVYHRAMDFAPDWTGKTKEFIVTSQLKNGQPKTDKDGNTTHSLRLPKDDDWTLLKKKTETDIDKSAKEIGEFIYDALLLNPKQKIKGKLVRTIDRKYYKNELSRIIETQAKYIPQLSDKQLYAECIAALYQSNTAYRNSIACRDFKYLLIDDILFYQRPLKSKKSLIAECPYEYHEVADNATGEIKRYGIKCIAKSHPLYQEFRLWQFIYNLRIYAREKEVDGRLKTDVDVTAEFLKSEADYTALFAFLNDRKDVSQDILLSKHFGVKKPKGKNERMPFRWNYVEDKSYPCNETHSEIRVRLDKAKVDANSFFSRGLEEALWHILYSVSDKAELKSALASFAEKHSLGNGFAEVFSKFTPFRNEYGAYSAKAIKKLLPLMRRGDAWSESNIDGKTAERIQKITDGEVDEAIAMRAREKAIHLKTISDFKGLPLWLACYVVYNRHSEAADISKWKSPADIDVYLKQFKQHSLRNPIVEQVMLESLRVVRDIWKYCCPLKLFEAE